jgi:hypothetical protein
MRVGWKQGRCSATERCRVRAGPKHEQTRKTISAILSLSLSHHRRRMPRSCSQPWPHAAHSRVRCAALRWRVGPRHTEGSLLFGGVGHNSFVLLFGSHILGFGVGGGRLSGGSRSGGGGRGSLLLTPPTTHHHTPHATRHTPSPCQAHATQHAADVQSAANMHRTVRDGDQRRIAEITRHPLNACPYRAVLLLLPRHSALRTHRFLFTGKR